MNDPVSTSDSLLELPPVRGEPLARRVSRYVRRHWARMAIIAGVAITIGHMLGGIAGYWEFSKMFRQHGAAAPAASPASTAPRPFRSFAVMPLLPASDAPADQQAARELTASLTTAVASGFRDGMVVSRGLAEQFTPQKDPRALGRDLNVRYVLVGRVEAAAPARQLVVELIDSLDGSQVWTGRQSFEGTATSDAVRKIRNALRNSVADATEKEVQSLPAQQKAVWELVLRAWNAGDSIAEMKRQQQLFEEALRLDPNFLPALLGYSHQIQLRTQEEPNRHDELVAQLDDLSQRAVRIAPNDVRAWYMRAQALRLQGVWTAAFAANDEALRLDPYRAHTLSRRAALTIYAGRPAEALPLLDRALELDPTEHSWYVIWRCCAHVHLARYAEALPDCEKGAASFGYWTMYAMATAASAGIGDMEGAQRWKRKMLAAKPDVSIAFIHSLRDSNHPDFLRQRENMVAGLRKAGVPER